MAHNRTKVQKQFGYETETVSTTVLADQYRPSLLDQASQTKPRQTSFAPGFRLSYLLFLVPLALDLEPKITPTMLASAIGINM